MQGEVIIYRIHQDDNQTTGGCLILGENKTPLFAAISLERGWRDNEVRVSCIPKGEYNLEYEYSNRFKKKLWEIKDVPCRSECKFHSANYWHQLNGCVALGVSPRDLNGDGYIDVTSSKKTMAEFEKVLSQFDTVTLKIM
tara:strand:+ start:211 stop:630 length:420 start_codon:yes stop_codon:yes gene_type:complete